MSDYYHTQRIEFVKKTRELQEELPIWYGDYLRSIETVTSALTRLNYTRDIRVFFRYLIAENRRFQGVAIEKITPDMLGDLTLRELEMYVEYLGYYISDEEKEFANDERGKARKISSLRSLFRYLYREQKITSNPAELIATPKLHHKAIIRLSPDEAARLMDAIENGEGLTQRQKQYQRKTVLRDFAIVMLFLTTGIRVSELVGLNVGDFNFKDNSFLVTRKGGNQATLYFEIETADAILRYLESKEEEQLSPSSPLFLSMQNKRITVRSVEKLVQKYARIASPHKKITPHKLRSTYGTMLYEETGDIYLVADVLGHKDVNTTKTHYAAMSEARRRMAAKAVKIRDDESSHRDDNNIKE